jgi:hypothetical protein
MFNLSFFFFLGLLLLLAAPARSLAPVEWTFLGPPSTTARNQLGEFPSPLVASSDVFPTSRRFGAQWTDPVTGDFIGFGGYDFVNVYHSGEIPF